jgi:hypothetical protein
VVREVPRGAACPNILIALGTLRYTVHSLPPIVVVSLLPPWSYSLAVTVAEAATVAVVAAVVTAMAAAMTAAATMAAATMAAATTAAVTTVAVPTVAAVVVAMLMAVAAMMRAVTMVLWWQWR